MVKVRSRNMTMLLLGIAVMLLATGCFGLFQSKEARVDGTVVNEQGNAIIDAVVTLTGAKTFRTETNEDGAFAFSEVPFARYTLIVEDAVTEEVLHIDEVSIRQERVKLNIQATTDTDSPHRTNLYPPKIASPEDYITEITGFTMTAGTEEVELDTTRSLNGLASLRIVGSSAKQGVWVASMFVPDNRETYTASAYIYGKKGDQFYIELQEKGPKGTGVEKSHNGDTFTLEGDGWERIHATATMEKGDSLGIVIRSAKKDHDFEVWVDQLQLELGSEPTAWEEPPLSRNLLTYNQATVEYDTRGFIGAKGSGEVPVMTLDTSEAWEGNSSLKVEGVGDGANEGYYMWSAFVPNERGTYTASLYLKGTPGDRFFLVLEEKGKAGTGKVEEHVGDVFELQSSDWERHSITATMQEGHTLGFVLRHADASPFTVWVDGLQLEEGSAATRWVAPSTEM